MSYHTFITIMRLLFRRFIPALAGIFISLSAMADTVDHYQLYIGDKLMLRGSEAMVEPQALQVIPLDSSLLDETIRFFYTHCSPGTGKRQLVLTMLHDTIPLLRWDFANDPGEMRIPIREILRYEKLEAGASLTLYYFDEQVRAGKAIAGFAIINVFPNKPVKKSSSSSILYILIPAVLLPMIITTMIIQRKKKRAEEKNQ